GDGETGTEPTPITISPPAGVTYSLLVSGGATSYALSTKGEVYSWGANSDGTIGNGVHGAANVLAPVEVESGVSHISATAQNVVTS
ncbi:MAG: hypothetical protein ABSG81_13120, partial [Acidimicrobiales bacterium]